MGHGLRKIFNSPSVQHLSTEKVIFFFQLRRPAVAYLAVSFRDEERPAITKLYLVT